MEMTNDGMTSDMIIVSLRKPIVFRTHTTENSAVSTNPKAPETCPIPLSLTLVEEEENLRGRARWWAPLSTWLQR